MNERRDRIVVIGAGPIGLEAAAEAVRRGYPTIVLDAGVVGQHVESWRHVRLFTPFGMSTGPAGFERMNGDTLPGPEDEVTGGDLRESYLLPLAHRLGEAGADIRTGSRVVTVTRSSLLKGEALGAPERGEDAFRLLVDRNGGEEVVEAEIVLDCTGTYARPNWLGGGGGPAVGERALREEIVQHIPDIEGAARAEYAEGTTLLVGSGHSAATAAVALAALVRSQPGGSFLWATRGSDRAVPEVPDDSLASRASLLRSANAIAAAPPPGSAWLPGTQVTEIRRAGAGFEVVLQSGDGRSTRQVQRIVGLVGYEPDDSLYRQLQIHECYASRGPMALAAALLAASGSAGGDCLKLGGFGPQALRNPEPNYFILGAKSYGRNSAFLLNVGYEQVRDVFALL